MDSLIINANVLPMSSQYLLLENMYVAIHDQTIVKLGPMSEMSTSLAKQIFDLEGKYVLPGLIDLHAHIVEEPETDLARHRTIVSDSSQTIIQRAARNLKDALHAGITTICDCGSPGNFTLQMRNSVETGAFEGSRLFVCGPILTAPGNHGAEWGWEVSGQALPQAIRDLSALNVDFIKIVNDPIAYTLLELAEAVAEAHQLGMRVACHAYTEDAIWLASKAGCDSIEHGVACSPEMMAYIQENGIAIVPTYICALKSSIDPDKSLLSQQDVEKYFYPWLELLQRELSTCLAAPGLRIGAGTDAGFPPLHFASLIDEIQAFVKMGASPYKALSTATSVGTEIRGLNNNLGAIQIGKIADIIATNRNPLEDINALNDVVFVMKEGKLIKNQVSKAQ